MTTIYITSNSTLCVRYFQAFIVVKFNYISVYLMGKQLVRILEYRKFNILRHIDYDCDI